MPARPADLFAAKPLVIVGRYDRPGQGASGCAANAPGRSGYAKWRCGCRRMSLSMTCSRRCGRGIAWKILMSEDWSGAQHSQLRGDLKESITQLGLKFRLMTQFTSFVAVEASVVTQGGVPTRVEVPVELPHGVSYEGIFGGGIALEADAKLSFRAQASAGGYGMHRQAPAIMAAESVPAPPVRGDMSRLKPIPAQREAIAKLDPKLQNLSAGSMVEVKVWLTDDSPAVIARLKQLGLSVRRQAAGKILYGRIDAGVLAALAGQDAVLFVSKDIGQP
jgi:Ca-activated chloride channel family protein